MSQTGRVNRLVDVLQRYGFYQGSSDPGMFNRNVKKALDAFLASPKGVGPKKVINALKIFDKTLFHHIKSNTDCVTHEVRSAVKALFEKHGFGDSKEVKIPNVELKPGSDIDYMQSWETGGVRVFT